LSLSVILSSVEPQALVLHLALQEYTLFAQCSRGDTAHRCQATPVQLPTTLPADGNTMNQRWKLLEERGYNPPDLDNEAFVIKPHNP
jgi:hypothetical protein